MKYIISLYLLFASMAIHAAEILEGVSILNASSAVSGMAATNLVNGSGMNDISLSAVHDNSSTGATMWSSSYKWSDINVTFDMGNIYNLANMYIWNFNQEGNTDKGMKNVKIEYSMDNTVWTALAAPANPGYIQDANYPFQLAQATGLNGMAATNLNDGSNTPVNINANARYVRISSAQIGTASEGNWGGAATGLSEVIFTYNPEISIVHDITVDVADVVNTCGHLVFGGCHSPSHTHVQTMLPLFIDAGINTIRMDFWLENVVPSISSVEEYYNNVNDCRNADKWDYSNIELMVQAKQAGMTTMMIIAYCPPWLAYNGQASGVPKDMDVYTEIVREVYSRYHQYIDYVEFYNEPGYFFKLDGSPYTSVGKALADMYIPCYEVVQSISPGKPMGGLSVVTSGDGGVGGRTNQDFFSDPRITTSNFNYYSHHVYSDYGIETSKETVTRVKNALAQFGFGDLPVWFTEWSYSIANSNDHKYYYGKESVTYSGKCLVNWMRDGITGAHHWNLKQVREINNSSEPGANTDAHGMYAWDATTKTGWLLPKAYVFKMMSRSLALGKGQNNVLQTTNPVPQVVNVASFTNSEGVTSVVIVNENETGVTRLKLHMEGLTGVTAVQQYTVTYTMKGETPTSLSFENNNGTEVTVDVPASSVVGVKFVK